MSQRTRAASAKPEGHATPAPAKKPRARRAPTTPAGTAPAATAPTPGAEPVSGEELARVLRAVAGELERDPALARRVAEAMGGASPAPEAAPPAPEAAPPAPEAASPAPEAAPPAPEAAPPAPEAAPPAPLAPAAEEGRATAPAPPVKSAGAREAEAPEADAPPPVVVGRSFRPRLVTGLAPDLGLGVPDPFALRARLGEAGLRAALADLRLGTLRAMVREHALDPTGRLKGVNDAAKLRAAILAATRAHT